MLEDVLGNVPENLSEDLPEEVPEDGRPRRYNALRRHQEKFSIYYVESSINWTIKLNDPFHGIVFG